jgi:hypothetical protein
VYDHKRGEWGCCVCIERGGNVIVSVLGLFGWVAVVSKLRGMSDRSKLAELTGLVYLQGHRRTRAVPNNYHGILPWCNGTLARAQHCVGG